MLCRLSLACVFVLLAGLAFVETRLVEAGQSAVSHSKPGHEDLTFWAHRRGLEEIDFEGEAGFGDIARVLLRKRENAAPMAAIRDRFTFRTLDMTQLAVSGAFHIEVGENALVWRNRPERFIATAGRAANFTVIASNRALRPAELALNLGGGQAVPTTLAPGASAGVLLRFREEKPGNKTVTLEARASGKSQAAELSVEVRPSGKLRARLLEENGTPAAARVYVTGSDGLAYVPKGRIPRITAMSAEYYFHAEGDFEVTLPAGPSRVEAIRGQEYEPAATLVEIEPGKTAQAELRLKRWADMASGNWYSADSHIHANYVAPHHQVMTPEDMRLIAAAEDLNNANLLVANSGGAFIHDRQYFEGKPHSLSTSRHILYWNEEFRNGGLYGHIAFFNLKSLIEPFYTGFRDTPHWEDYPPNHHAARAGKQQGAAVTYVHPGMSSGLDQTDWGAGARELPVDAALGVIDAMDVISNNDEIAPMELWYRLLNCGLRIAVSAGTDAFTNATDHYTPGGGRVYVNTNAPLNYAAWVERYRGGHSFASNHPVVELRVEGRGPGDEIRLEQPGKVRVEARVRSIIPLDRVDIVNNGIAAVSRRGFERGEVVLNGEIRVDRSGWIAARAVGPRHRLVLNDWGAFVHTSPVYVTVAGRKPASRDDARFWIAWIERLAMMVEKRGRFSTGAKRQEVLDLFQKAIGVYRQVEARDGG